MMQNNEPHPLCAVNVVDQNPTYINSTEFVVTDNVKPPKKQRRPSTKVSSKKIDEPIGQQHSSCANNFEYKPFTQQQYQPIFNPLLPHLPFNSFNSYLPLPYGTYGANSTSYPYNQFVQQREASRPSAMQSMMQMAFNRNQPAQYSTELYHQQPMFGLTEQQPLFGLTDVESHSQLTPNMSQMYSQSRAWMDSETMKRRHYDSGEMSAFESCKKPRQDSISTLSSYTDASSSNSPHSTQSIDTKDDAVVSGNQVENKKALDAANVIDLKFDFSCVICQETKKDTVLLPCRHLCVCEKCCLSILICPLCRKTFDERLTVFT